MKPLIVMQNLCAPVAPVNTTIVVKGSATNALICQGDRKPAHAII
ncbi:hypothetical protein [Vibrio ponticus]|nr:hypothetical protein [Vibrio ponticus]